MRRWLKDRLYSLIDNLIFAVIISGGAVLLAAIKQLPLEAVAGIGIVLFAFIVGIARLIVYWLRNIEVVKSGLHGIVPVLEQMDSLLREQARKMAGKPFDRKKYERINEKINAEVFKVSFGQVHTAEDARGEMNRVLPSFVNQTQQRTRAERYKIAKVRVGVLDSESFGMKGFRKKRTYKNLLNTLSRLRNNVTDDTLNKNIREHIDESETSNTMLLDIERAKGLTANESDSTYRINDFVSSEVIAALESFNQEYRERLIEKRRVIGKRIELLENRGKNVVHTC